MKRTKVRLASPPAFEAQAARDACLVQIYPTGPEIGTRFALTDVSLIIGRDASCEIPVNNPFLSRHHARIQPVPEGYHVVDLQSTNGTYVNDIRVSEHRLRDGDNLRLGNCIFRFLTSGNIEAQYHEEIRRLSIIDALTSAYNQRFLLEYLQEELVRAEGPTHPLALIMFDIDHFKAINDEHGHLAGDHVLRELVAAVNRLTRERDVLARYGGEEFALVLPDTPLSGAVQVAERARRIVEELELEYDGKPFRVTISLGVASATAEPGLSPVEFIGRADARLYDAKRQGRNRVVS